MVYGPATETNKRRSGDGECSGSGARRTWGRALVFILIGVAGIVFGQDLAFGSAARMGPGYFPTLLSWLIIAIGLVLARQIARRPKGRRSSPFISARCSLIIAAILAFGYLIDRIGLALTAAVLTIGRRLCAARRRT